MKVYFCMANVHGPILDVVHVHDGEAQNESLGTTALSLA
jgi:hypothetical protein